MYRGGEVERWRGGEVEKCRGADVQRCRCLTLTQTTAPLTMTAPGGRGGSEARLGVLLWQLGELLWQLGVLLWLAFSDLWLGTRVLAEPWLRAAKLLSLEDSGGVRLELELEEAVRYL